MANGEWYVGGVAGRVKNCSKWKRGKGNKGGERGNIITNTETEQYIWQPVRPNIIANTVSLCMEVLKVYKIRLYLRS